MILKIEFADNWQWNSEKIARKTWKITVKQENYTKIDLNTEKLN